MVSGTKTDGEKEIGDKIGVPRNLSGEGTCSQFEEMSSILGIYRIYGSDMTIKSKFKILNRCVWKCEVPWFYNDLLYVHWCFAWMCVSVRASDTLELESQRVVSHHVGPLEDCNQPLTMSPAH